MKLNEFMRTLKAAAQTYPVLHTLYVELADVIEDVKEKHGIQGPWREKFEQGLLRHLNIEGIFRNGLDVSLEAHATVETQRFRARCNRPVELSSNPLGEGEG